jgi:hypothetical protein
MNLGFVMAFSPLALGSVEQEATHGGVPMATEQKTTIFRDNPFSRTTDYWCRQIIGVSSFLAEKRTDTNNPCARPV